MAKLSTDLRSATLHPRENQFLTSALASASAGAAVQADGCSTFFLAVSGTFVATYLVEGSVDGTNWFTLPMRPYNVASKLLVVSGTAVGQFVGQNPGFTQLRVRNSAFTSGSVAYTLAASNTVLDQSMEANVATSSGTATGAAAAAVTLTIASPGAGLRHYLTNLRIERHAAALLTAGTTPVIITSTNLPGTRAFSIPVEAAAQGTVYAAVENWPKGLATVAQATATTIVAPITTGVIWRITADWYVAP